MIPSGELQRFFDELVAYVREANRGSKLIAKDTFVRQRLAEMAIEIQIASLLSYRVAWMLDNGTVPNYESSMLKLFVTEVWHRLAKAELQIVGLYGQLCKDSKWAQIGGRPAFLYLSKFRQTIVAGTSEIQRSVIATRGLGLPRG